MPPAILLLWWIGRRSIGGLGRTTSLVALGVRIVVVTLLLGTLAEPNWRLVGRGVTTIFVWDYSRSMPTELRPKVRQYLERTVAAADHDRDRFALVTVAEDARVQLLPSMRQVPPEEQIRQVFEGGELDPGPLDGTDLASAIRVALAVKPEDTTARIVVFSDGNETEGSLLSAAQTAAGAAVPIDVLRIDTGVTSDVMFSNLVSPRTGRRGQTIDLTMLLEATAPTTGTVDLVVEGSGGDVVFDLDPESEGTGLPVRLDAGTNRVTVPVVLRRSGPISFRAVFTPDSVAGDAIPQNNEALTTTFVSSEGRVLLYARAPIVAEPLLRSLQASQIDVDLRPPVPGHASLTELQAFDAIILFDIAASDLTGKQQEELYAYVHDGGGGLVVIGGENSYGAGGWIDTKVAELLPLKLDPPAKRQIPKGALVLLMHSCEMPRGNYWGQECARAAVNGLSRLDLVGMVELDFSSLGAVTRFVHPLQEKGDGIAINQAINNLTFGDMQDFSGAMRLIYKTLQASDAAQKHVIIISDGDPSPPPQSLIQQYARAKISISTVCVFPHGGAGDVRLMQSIAEATDGEAYLVDGSQGNLADLPAIFFKEAQIVRRTLIEERSPPFAVQTVNVGAETMRGFDGLPPVGGYIVTADRDGLSQVTARSETDDPILAQWQFGLGRVVAFTSDCTGRWCDAWLGWSGFSTFWDQHLRWAMRPSGSANVSLVTRRDGNVERVIVTALDAQGESLNFARFRGRVTRPNFEGGQLDFAQTGPGRYETQFDAGDPGTYLLSLEYQAPGPGETLERGFVQAAVARPFADEFRVLEDNAPLLEQVSSVTSGRVLTGDPNADELFDDEGLRPPVARTPIWLAVAILSIGLFLTDVAVRRVRFGPADLVRILRRGVRRTRGGEAGRIDTLRAARARAQERLAERSDRDAERSGVKFEADPDAAAPAGSPIDSPPSNAPARPAAKPAAESKPAADDEEGGMSRLLAAKRRALRDRENDDESGTG